MIDNVYPESTKDYYTGKQIGEAIGKLPEKDRDYILREMKNGNSSKLMEKILADTKNAHGLEGKGDITEDLKKTPILRSIHSYSDTVNNSKIYKTLNKRKKGLLSTETSKVKDTGIKGHLNTVAGATPYVGMMAGGLATGNPVLTHAGTIGSFNVMKNALVASPLGGNYIMNDLRKSLQGVKPKHRLPSELAVSPAAYDARDIGLLFHKHFGGKASDAFDKFVEMQPNVNNVKHSLQKKQFASMMTPENMRALKNTMELDEKRKARSALQADIGNAYNQLKLQHGAVQKKMQTGLNPATVGTIGAVGAGAGAMALNRQQ
jgi:hypothetical protein